MASPALYRLSPAIKGRQLPPGPRFDRSLGLASTHKASGARENPFALLPFLDSGEDPSPVIPSSVSLARAELLDWVELKPHSFLGFLHRGDSIRRWSFFGRKRPLRSRLRYVPLPFNSFRMDLQWTLTKPLG